MPEQLTPGIILGLIGGYFFVLFFISYFTGKKSDNASFFLANRESPWILVAIGMIGASLSGVTFISIPGVVGADGLNQAFSYMQVVLGYLFGYVVIAEVLMPLYYRLDLTSIYGYLKQRFGPVSYKTGASFFLLSRTIGSSFRLYLVAIVLQQFVMNSYGVPFWMTVCITILLIWIYTFRGGIRTIVYTDTIQTVSMLAAVALTIWSIGGEMDLTIGQLTDTVRESDYSQMFFFEEGWSDPNNFFKQFFSGMLITIVMTGLDQDMMQKNLSCRNIGEAKKNMYTFCVILVFANALFLTLGALLYLYAGEIGLQIPAQTDQLYPTIALEYLPPYIGIVFVIGLIAAAYSSADSALTSLTTAFCVDFLGIESSEESDRRKKYTRMMVHVGFSLVFLTIVLIFHSVSDSDVITQLFIAAGYTYGPLLGLYSFGLLTGRSVRDRYVLIICLLAPVFSYVFNAYSDEWFGGLKLGFLILALNGLLTYTGLLVISSPGKEGPEAL